VIEHTDAEQGSTFLHQLLSLKRGEQVKHLEQVKQQEATVEKERDGSVPHFGHSKRHGSGSSSRGSNNSSGARADVGGAHLSGEQKGGSAAARQGGEPSAAPSASAAAVAAAGTQNDSSSSTGQQDARDRAGVERTPAKSMQPLDLAPCFTSAADPGADSKSSLSARDWHTQQRPATAPTSSTTSATRANSGPHDVALLHDPLGPPTKDATAAAAAAAAAAAGSKERGRVVGAWEEAFLAPFQTHGSSSLSHSPRITCITEGEEGADEGEAEEGSCRRRQGQEGTTAGDSCELEARVDEWHPGE